MWDVVPFSVLLVGLLGVAVLGFALARIVFLEARVVRAQRPAPVVVAPEPLPGFRAAA